MLQYFADKFVCYKKKKKAKLHIKKLFYDTGAFSHKHTTAFAQIIRTMGGMPDLSALHNIDDIIIMTPEIFIFIFFSAVKNSKQRVSAGKPPEANRID